MVAVMDLRLFPKKPLETQEEFDAVDKNYVYKIIVVNDRFKQVFDMFTADPAVVLFGTRPHDLAGWEMFYVYFKEGVWTDEEIHTRYGEKYPFIAICLD